jgi:large subunit ribosomal protein L31e
LSLEEANTEKESDNVVEEDIEKKEKEETTEVLEKPPSETTEEIEEDIVEERFYTIPLGRARIRPRKKHAPRAINILREFVTKHMKVSEDSIKITNKVNNEIWFRGIEKPPRKIKVKVTKNSEGIVTIRSSQGD